MRYVWTILLLLPAACSLAPGQLDAIKIHNYGGCVSVAIQGSPAGGTASTTTTLTPPKIGTGLGVMALDSTTAPSPSVMQTCTATPSHNTISTPAP